MKQPLFGKRLVPMLLALLVLAGVFGCPVLAAQQEAPAATGQPDIAQDGRSQAENAEETSPAAPASVSAQLNGIKGLQDAELALGEIADTAQREGYRFLYAEVGNLQVVTILWDAAQEAFFWRTLAGDTVSFDPDSDTLLLYYQQESHPVFHTAQAGLSSPAAHTAPAPAGREQTARSSHDDLRL